MLWFSFPKTYPSHILIIHDLKSKAYFLLINVDDLAKKKTKTNAVAALVVHLADFPALVEISSNQYKHKR